jgi:steroid delta-isomerase-like uncharacterized protein
MTASAQHVTPKEGAIVLPPAVERFIAAFEAANADGLADSYTEAGVLEEVAFGQTFTGREAIRQNEATFLAAFTDVTIQVSNVIASGDRAALEFSFSGTYSGQLPEMPAGQSQSVAFRGASILQASDGGITLHTQYFDALSILVQLGAMVAPGA